MPLTSSQRNAANQFMSVTGVSDRTAQRADFGPTLASAPLYSYFSHNPSLAGPDASAKEALNSLFDSLATQAGESKSLGLDSTMAYISKLGFSLEDIEILILFEIIQVPTIGEITRSGFVDGWVKLGNSQAGHKIPTDLQSQAAHVRSLLSQLATNHDVFRRVHRHTFLIGREENQRALSLENAKMYWDLLFGRTGYTWGPPWCQTKWLEVWKTFLDEKWTHTVSRDMWNQTLEFAYKSVADETLGFWREDGAWPGVIDNFVIWCREKKVVPSTATGNHMEIDT